MLVKFKPCWGRFVEKTMELSQALRPEAYSEGGAVEQAQAQAEANAKAIGALAALLVERGHISLEAAAEACGVSDEMEIVKP